MARLELTVLARSPQLLLDRAQALGLERDDLLAVSGFSEPELRDPDARVPRVKLIRLWRRIAEAVPDPALGLKLGASIGVRELGLVGYTMQFSTTLGQAFQRLRRYCRLLSDDIRVEIEEHRRGAEIILGARLELAALRHPVDARVAMVLAVTRQLTGVDVAPLEVRLPYPRPPDPGSYRRFFQAPVRFEPGTAALVLERRALDLPIPTTDATLGRYLKE